MVEEIHFMVEPTALSSLPFSFFSPVEQSGGCIAQDMTRRARRRPLSFSDKSEEERKHCQLRRT
jgi:hypothetical protein